ncbi:hypothetical protein, partial [Streptomyces diastaticus]
MEGAETLVPGVKVDVVGFAELGSEVGVLGVGEGQDASALVRREGQGASGAQVSGCVIWSSIAEALSLFHPHSELVRCRVRVAWTRLVIRVVEHR